jgi:hypothetical protein
MGSTVGQALKTVPNYSDVAAGEFREGCDPGIISGTITRDGGAGWFALARVAAVGVGDRLEVTVR